MKNISTTRKSWRRLVVMALLVFNMNMSYAQNVRLDYKDVSLKSVMEAITSQTGYNFVYTGSSVKDALSSKVSVTSNDESLKTVLDKIFGQANLSYKIEGKSIAINLRQNVQAAKSAAQKIVVKGVVSDKYGEPLPGVIIQNLSNKKNTATDIDGQYTMECHEGDVLEFSMMGMGTEEVTVGRNKTINVSLEEDAMMLDDVVVTGYQEVSRNQSTSSVAVVKTDKLNLTGVVSIEGALQGQIAGLSVTSATAGPGAAPKVRVRGTSTIMGSGEPLWVMDGVILENSVPVTPEELNSPDFLNTFNSAIGGVSPNDIESITVLKDASATAIYGTRAANGVIVVTTKKGKANQPRIAYAHSSKVSLRPSYNDFNLMNSKELVDFNMTNKHSSGGHRDYFYEYKMGQISRDEFVAGVRKAQTINTDWFDILYRNAYTHTHDLSYSGGTDRMNYYVSMNFTNDQGLDKISKYNSLGGMAKVNAEIFKGVKLGAQIQASRRHRDSYMSHINPFTYAVSTSRSIPLYNEDGSYLFYGYNDFNILYEQENTHKESLQNDIKGNLTLDVDIYKGLKYKGLVSYSTSNSKSFDYAKETSEYVAGIRGYDFGKGSEEDMRETKLPYGGIYHEDTYLQESLLVRNVLDYSHLFGDNICDFSIMAGHEFRSNNYIGLSSTIYGYMHDRGSIFYNPQESEEFGHVFRNTSDRSIIKRSNESYFGVLSAAFLDRYILNANIRFDGSNLFGSNPKYRYLPLWSASAKWIVSNEKFMQNAGSISFLAIRGSYGLRGNIVEESSPQIIASALPPNASTGLLEMIINQPPNPDLKWETTASLNLGLDLSMFNHRLNFTADYYRDKSSDLVAFSDMSSVSGFSGKYVNFADVLNWGIDASISGDIIKTKTTTWTMAVNMGYVKNKVVKSSIASSVDALVGSTYVPGNVVVGYPINGMFAFRSAGLDEGGVPQFYDKDGNVIKTDDDRMGLIYTDVDHLKYIGPREPVFTGGFNNILKIKDFTVSCLFSFGLGGKARLPQVAYDYMPSDTKNVNKSILNAWQKPGDEKNPNCIPSLNGDNFFWGIDGEGYYSTDMYNKSDAAVVSGDYFRLRNVTLEYRFPKSVTKHLRITGQSMGGLSLKFQATNLFVVKDKRLEGYDPETVNYSYSGYGSLPLPRTFSLGLNFNF